MKDHDDLLNLSPEERLDLIHELWQSLESENLPAYDTLTKEQEQDILLRLDRLETGEAKVYSWNEVKRLL